MIWKLVFLASFISFFASFKGNQMISIFGVRPFDFKELK